MDRVLVIGSGGREHALAWKLAQEAEVFVAPGNPGVRQVGEITDVQASDCPGLLELCKRLSPKLVVIGPEAPLIAGLANVLRGEGFRVFGPGSEGARLEGSKAFSKDLMREAGAVTAEYRHFTNAKAASDFALLLFEAGKQVVVKASGEALGKGVILCATHQEAEDAIHRMMVERAFGDAGSTVVVEERLNGPEFSLLTLCSDGRFQSLPVAQDYKRIQDGDQGPNTGGMGSFSPVGRITTEAVSLTETSVVAPALRVLRDRKTSYRGVLFSGLLVQDGIPYCLEYNVRFGDPETQSIMPRLGRGFYEALTACADGEEIPAIEVNDIATVTVVLASPGYPGPVLKGSVVHVGNLPEGVLLFHAGTSMRGNELLTAGGRVMGVTGLGSTIEAARTRAYKGVESIHFEGMQYRSDIAQDHS